MPAASTGHSTHVIKILLKTLRSVALPEKRFQPIIAPTMAWEVETGIPDLVIEYTATAADRAVMNAPAKVEIAPSLPSVWEVPLPDTTAPKMTKIEQTIAAVRQLTIFVPTAVPKTFAASFAPSAQPKNKPLLRKIRTNGSMH